ncbi:ATP-binding protein [Streptomyces sp. ODS05-4]|uniref:ATP-binding protein n=1 Tax=Streptomyces sp. ODS05-4 TaxID=2944939 RepID=UPI00210B020A|nr:ATP-binding protein [Streptomyces sp. ODS05-4]
MTVTTHSSTAGPGGSMLGGLADQSAVEARRDVTEVLEHRPEAAATARHFARDVLADWQVDSDTAAGVMLVVSELVTNAVEHAEPPLALQMRRDLDGDGLWIAVSDGGAAEHDGAWTTSCEDDEHGRGLTIVDSLADAHGSDHYRNGTAVHWAFLHSA